MKKNVSGQTIGCHLAALADGTPVTAGTTIAWITGDNGTQTVGTTGSGACVHKGNGFWTYAPSQAETNFDHIDFAFVNAAAIPSGVQLYTTYPQSGDNFSRLGAPAGASLSADVAAVLAKVLDAAATRAALGMSTANMDTQLALIASYIDTEVADIQSRLPAALVGGKMDSNATVDNAAVASAVWSVLVSTLLAYPPGSIGRQIGNLLNQNL